MSNSLQIANCIVEPSLGRIQGSLAEAHVEPKSMDVLLTLYAANGEVVSREQILQQVWPNQIISDDVLNNAISRLRKAFMLAGGNNKCLQTLPRKGYRLVWDADSTLQRPPAKLNNTTSISIPTEDSSKTGKVYFHSTKRSIRSSAALMMMAIALLLLLLALATNYWTRQLNLERDILALHIQQGISYNAFSAQVKRRNELVEMITRRLGVQRELQYEKFFAKYYPALNDQERFVFAQIRGITEGELLKSNQAMLKIIQSNPMVTETFPAADALRKHLSFWISKYHSVFVKRADMCLLYAGVEDGVPYPADIDQQISTWLEMRNIL
ncbi:winged helix-turn-helix domain-containing protein [Aliiglaciecola sp. LCG003]|uniref:winged helix-turn-helix domain-containing protein n=1 Tax=Aliiglaciecola sp. LCG003 TaxID=3053655 RepID=UPI0025730605|nr:winged helix-turn-helix domain-containing protein [Aliiglaciecola sp. LCG003]WJG09961.1 winged helix-turn-helix domain-containing protein [Aliiglaciecola sp. LCG003]